MDQTAPAKPAMGMHSDAEHSKMHANMMEMKAQMAKIHTTANTKERQRLMHAHKQTMQERMGMMQLKMDQMIPHQQALESMPVK